jgi:PKD repeat protein
MNTTTPVNILKNASTTFTASTTGNNGSTKYKWEMGNGRVYQGTATTCTDNKGTKSTADDGPCTGTTNASSVPHVYAVNGTYKVKLTVTSSTGQSSSTDSGLVSVKNTFASTAWTATMSTPGVDKRTVTFANLPSAALADGDPAKTDKVYVDWGDGTYKAVYMTAGPNGLQQPAPCTPVPATLYKPAVLCDDIPWANSIDTPEHTYLRPGALEPPVADDPSTTNYDESKTVGWNKYHKKDADLVTPGDQPGYMYSPRARIFNAAGSIIQGKALPKVILLD